MISSRGMSPLGEPDLSIYGGTHPNDLPRYSYRDAQRATGVPASTIGAWFRGTTYRRGSGVGHFKRVLQRPDPNDSRLSFINVLEIHVLRALREVHDVRLTTVRQAILAAQQHHGIPRLLVSSQLKTSGGDLFLDSYLELVQLSQSSQMAMRNILKQYLQRIRLGASELDAFFPIPKSLVHRDEELVLVSPFISFGEPVIKRVGVSISAIAERVDVGEDKNVIMEDYGLREDEFNEAVLYQTAA